MSETKFTPGEWRTRQAQGIIDIIAADGTVITDLTLSLGGDEEHNEEFRANAALIAAAPELLEALQEAVYWLRQTPVMWAEPIDKAEAVIRKAISVGRGNAASTPPGKQEAAAAQVKVADQVYAASEKDTDL